MIRLRYRKSYWVILLLAVGIPFGDLRAEGTPAPSPTPNLEADLIGQILATQANNLSQIDIPGWLHKVDGILSGTLTVQPPAFWVLPAIYASLIAGCLLLAWSALRLLIDAFRTHIYWGAALFLPGVNLIAAPAFIIRHWSAARSGLSMAALSVIPLFILPLALCGTMLPVTPSPMVLPINRLPVDLLVQLRASNQAFAELEADYNSLLARAEQFSTASPIERDQYLIDKKRYIENTKKAQKEKVALEETLRQLNIQPVPMPVGTPMPVQ